MVWKGTKKGLFGGAITAATIFGIYYIVYESSRFSNKGEDKYKLPNRLFERLEANLNSKVEVIRSFSPSSRSKMGYMLALKYYEQQTQATRNFLQWQCLANNFNMTVVEPFLYKSTISFPFSEMARKEHPLRFGDIMNMQSWNEQTASKFNYANVAKWVEFLRDAPRSVIIVCAKYRNPPFIQVPVPGHYYRSGCKKTCFEHFNVSLSFLARHGFKLVNKVCANFAGYAGSVREDSFMRDILGSYKHSEVTVLLNEFRGFYGLYRVPVLSQCGIVHASVNISLKPSSRLIRDVRRYTTAIFKRKGYAAILVRIEKLVLHSRRNVTECAQETLSILSKLKKTRGLRERFLAMDVGRFGSRGSKLHHLKPYGEEFFRLLYGTKWSFEDWERSFSLSSSINPAYVANFQRTIAAHGECLIMVGAGGFQGQARNMYDSYHPELTSRCVYKVCSEPLGDGRSVRSQEPSTQDVASKL